MTNLPARNTRLSLIGLGVLGLGAVGILFYTVDEWLAGGAAVRKMAETCDVIGANCNSAYSSVLQIIGSPQQLLFTLALAAFILAALKAAVVLFSARKAACSYQDTEKNNPRVAKALESLGITDVSVKVSDNSSIAAFTYGLVRPVICVSRGVIEHLDDSELEALLAHELGHVKRRDNLAIFVALFVKDFLWPLPVSHHLFSIFVHEKEYAADDFAAELTGKPVELAGAIVTVAKATQGVRRLSPAYATFFSDKATAKTRVHRLLGSAERNKPSLAKLVASTVLSLVILVGVVGLAYAQPVAKITKLDSCSMGVECLDKGGECCK